MSKEVYMFSTVINITQTWVYFHTQRLKRNRMNQHAHTHLGHSDYPHAVIAKTVFNVRRVPNLGCKNWSFKNYNCQQLLSVLTQTKKGRWVLFPNRTIKVFLSSRSDYSWERLEICWWLAPHRRSIANVRHFWTIYGLSYQTQTCF